MIGMGGWGGRNEKSGPCVYFDADGKIVRDTSAGKCGTHRPLNEFVLTMRDKTHPSTKNLPDFWMHSKDECYSLLRGQVSVPGLRIEKVMNDGKTQTYASKKRARTLVRP